MSHASSGLSFPIEKQILRERCDPQNKKHKNKYREQATKRGHEPFLSHHHIIRIHFLFPLFALCFDQIIFLNFGLKAAR
tara:strand:- start:58 stop:294 length:237 start_codon:yes stop_codon:yes gene_type:complete